MAKKILYLLIGLALIALAICTIFVDGLTGFLCGIGMFLYGIGTLVQWIEHKKDGSATILSLIGSAFSVVIGILVLMGSTAGQAYVLRRMVFTIAFFLIVSGIFEIIGAIIYRKAMTSVDLGVQAPGSVLTIILGCIMIVLGVLGFIFPFVAAYACGAVLTLQLFVVGIRLILQARSAGVLEEST